MPDVNLEIVEPGPEPDAVTMRVHERGAGITEACGTGAVRGGVGGRRAGGSSAPGTEELVVHMDGGSARVALDRPAPGHVTLTGPATYVATIEVPAREHPVHRSARRHAHRAQPSASASCSSA